MRASLRLAPALLALLACTRGNPYNQGLDPTLDDTGTGSTDGGTAGDGGGSDGGGGDGGTDGGGTDGGGGDGGGATGGSDCPHDYHPLATPGWTKTYDATFSFSGQAAKGTATEMGLGATTLPDGSSGWAYQDATTTSGESYDVTTYVGCNVGGDEGMFVVGWEGSYDMLIGGFLAMPYAVDAELSPARKYLPAGYELGAVGSWSYVYTLNVLATGDTGGPQSNPYSISGAYAEAGFQDITLFDGTTVNAYKLVNTYTKTDQTGQAVNGYIEQWWVRGLGLVKETHVNMDTGSEIASKTLTGYTGLSVME
ncbi:hypothetical protein L6R53_32180 [Myxococcota bacterium]|nr:hypothetical protein [Myxococcota bacterium]